MVHEAVTQQLPRALHPPLGDEIDEGPAGLLLDEVREVAGREVRRRRRVGERQPAGDVLAYVAQHARQRVAAACALANRFAASLRWPGAWIEYKGPSVAVHWRDAAPADGVEARAAFVAAASAPASSRFRLLDGDRVCEAVPDVPWHKGRAVEAMQRRLAGQAGLPPWTLFAGDDWTDEDAFEALGDAGVTVCVGDRPSAARFRLRGPAGVERLLAALARAPRLGPAQAPNKV